jgi:hypothetical protein
LGRGIGLEFGRRENNIYGLGGETLRKIPLREDLGVA